MNEFTNTKDLTKLKPDRRRYNQEEIEAWARMHLLNPNRSERTLCGHNSNFGRFTKNTTDITKVTCVACKRHFGPGQDELMIRWINK